MPPLSIIDRAGRAAGSGFHSAFATSFATEFAAVEELLVPQLMAVGCRNIGLVCDARMVSLALSDGSGLPRHLGRSYGLHAPPVGLGVFHPKIILQLGRDRGRAFVSSANLTAAGLCSNVEIGAEIECTAEASAARSLVQAVARYIDTTVQGPGAVRDALDWAWSRTPWLSEADEVVSEEVGFLTSLGDPGLLRSFVDRVRDPVHRLWVLSPYWDETLEALSKLTHSMSAARTTVLIDSENHEFPVQADLPPETVIVDIADWRPKRFTHAKLVLAQTATHDHLLFGSANCTSAALGNGSTTGRNAEACLYRRFPTGEAFEMLDLGRWRDAPPIDVRALPPRVGTPPIPLTALSASAPGRFSVENDNLRWTPPKRLDDEVADILLYDIDLVLTLEITGATSQGGHYHTVLSHGVGEAVRYAAIRHSNALSSLAGVEHPLVLRRTRREPLKGDSARASDWFSHAVDLDLFAVEALEALCRADQEAIATSRLSPSRVAERPPETQAGSRTLSYDDFMRERAQSDRSGASAESSLEGAHCDHVRQLLNRLSAYDDGVGPAATELDAEPTENLQPAPEVDLDRPVERAVDALAFERAVDSYAKACLSDDPVGPLDVLRLRLWVMLLLYNARCEACPRGLAATIDDRGWPRLMLRVLVAFFSGRSAPVSRLLVDPERGALPRDYIETWATVLWSLEVIERCRPDTPAGEVFTGFVQKLRVRIAAALKLDETDREGPVFRDRWAGLDRQIAPRLRLDRANS